MRVASSLIACTVIVLLSAGTLLSGRDEQEPWQELRDKTKATLKAPDQSLEDAERHALAAIERAEEEGAPLSAQAELLDLLGWIYYGEGRFEGSEQAYLKGLQLKTEANGELHPSIATSYDALSRLYDAAGDDAASALAARSSLQLRSQTLGSNHPLVAESWRRLAISLEGDGEFEEAEAAFRRALATAEAACDSEDPFVRRVLVNFRAFLERRGRIGEEQRMAARMRAIPAVEPDEALARCAERYGSPRAAALKP